MDWISIFRLPTKNIQQLLIYVLISLLLLVLPLSFKHEICDLVFTLIYSPFYQLSFRISQLYLVSLENEKLRKEVIELGLENQKLTEERLENLRLRELLDFGLKSAFKVIPAEVVALEADPLVYTVCLNIGEKEGVKADLPVINTRGLVGKVRGDLLEKENCWVELLAHPNCRVAALDQRSRVNGIIKPAPGLHLELDHVPIYEDVQIGDEIISSGLGGVFPAGLKIGRVIEVKEEKGGVFKSIMVKPWVDFNRLEELFMIEQIPDKSFLNLSEPTPSQLGQEGQTK